MQQFSFDNGLHVLVHRSPKLKNTSLNVLYKVGSKSECSQNTGLAHFLEHMMFEGTKEIPNYDAKLQSMMAENNAFTGQDYTCYFSSFPHKYIFDILSIEFDRMHHLSLKKSAIEIQKNIILEEFKETSLNPPLADVWHHLQKLCFRDTYQWPVIGKNLKHILAIDKKLLHSFYRTHYTPNNCTISIVTKVNETVVSRGIEDLFNTKIVEKNKKDDDLPSLNYKKSGGKKTLIRRNISNDSFFIAFHIDDYATKDYFTADMLSDTLTNGESSLLYKSLVLEKKLCTEIQSYTTDNISHNLLVIEGKLCTGISFEHIYSELDAVFQKLRSSLITTNTFETLYNKALSYWSFYHYSPTQLAQNMAIFYSARNIVDPAKYISEIYTTITKKDIKTTAQNVLNWQNASILEYKVKHL